MMIEPETDEQDWLDEPEADEGEQRLCPEAVESALPKLARLLVDKGASEATTIAYLMRECDKYDYPLNAAEAKAYYDEALAQRQAGRQTISSFLKIEFPPKEALVEGILYRRDQVSLTGRRRHGKTGLLHNLALAGALGKPEYLGYKIPRPFRTVSFYLEDDSREIQEKLLAMAGDNKVEGFDLYTRLDFLKAKVPIAIKNEKFRAAVREKCAAAKPDLIVFDNLGMLISANYNDAKDIHELMNFVFELTQEFNAAVLIAAHPRKGNKLDDTEGKFAISLLESPEKFFEECMGSSHFINSTGSLWGIERHQDDQTYLLLGAQRFTGQQSFTVAEKDEQEWFQRADNIELAKKAVVNTPTRKLAWISLPQPNHKFSYVQARGYAKSAGMRSSATFNAWWKELIRHRLVLEVEPGRYKRVHTPE